MYVAGERVMYKGDPLQDFTMIRFLDKFSFKNPKAISEGENQSVFGARKAYTSASVRRIRANTKEYLKLSEKAIPEDEKYLHEFMKHKEEQKVDEDDDASSVNSEEFDEVISKMVTGKQEKDIDFMEEVGDLTEKKKQKKKGKESIYKDPFLKTS